MFTWIKYGWLFLQTVPKNYKRGQLDIGINIGSVSTMRVIHLDLLINLLFVGFLIRVSIPKILRKKK